MQSRIHIEEYALHKLGKSLINLLTNEISGLYYSAIKDRLYCDSQKSSSRKAAQYTLKQILDVISLNVAPILPHLVEEININVPTNTQKCFFRKFHKGINHSWENNDVNEVMNVVLEIRKNLNLQLGSTTNKMNVNIQLHTILYEKFQVISTFNL